MDWIVNLFANTESVAHIALLYAIVIAIGVYLGKLKIGGISLGVTFVLFAGILAGHVGFTGPKEILTFVQDFGLILFVFMIGLQVGPGFFESFKKGGVTLNMLSASAILLNILVMFGCYYLFFDTSNPNNLPMMVGTLYGAVTNTPGLGAANEALLSVFPNGAPSIANGYACAYPLGVVGIIGATILTAAFKARILVWKAMPSITLIISAIFCELVEISRIVCTTLSTTLPPRCAVSEALNARWLAWRAFSAFCFTVAVSCSMLAAVSSSEAACCSVREERSLLPVAISLAPL